MTNSIVDNSVQCNRMTTKATTGQLQKNYHHKCSYSVEKIWPNDASYYQLNVQIKLFATWFYESALEQ